MIVCATLRKSLFTPRVNISRSRRSDTYTFTTRMPPIDSASRPVTSALITLRSRKSGRNLRKAIAIMPPKVSSTSSVTEVSRQLRKKRIPTATIAVRNPPTS